MLGDCKEEKKTCKECKDVSNFSKSLLKENKILIREVSVLTKRQQSLFEKLSSLNRCANSFETGTFSKKSSLTSPEGKQQSLMDYMMQINTSTSIFSIITNREIAISYVLQTGIYVPNMRCMCGKELELAIDPSNKDYVFICACQKQFYFFERSIWEPFKMTPEKLVYFIFLWLLGCKPKDLISMLGMETRSFYDLESVLTTAVSKYFIGNLPKFRGVVEIDESCFKSFGYKLQNKPREKWVFGLYERERKINYMELVPKRTTSHLIPIIQKICEPGTTIISDQWAAYNKLEEFGFPHFTVDHSRFFVNPHSREIHTQHIEISWCWAKYEIKRQNRMLVHLQDSLNVFCWKRTLKTEDKVLEISNRIESLCKILKETQTIKDIV